MVAAEVHRREWARVLSSVVRVTRDLDLAEECVQEAFARALSTWPRTGVPASPTGWLTTVARHVATDTGRREVALRRRLPLLVGDEVAADAPDPDELPDERLRLVFTCCHPALSLEAQVALTLRVLCGMSTAEVARAFLTSEATMAARITRAKKKIAQAGIPYRVPGREELPERVDAVLAVLHLLFTTGHTAPRGPTLVRPDLLARAQELARMLYGLLPLPEVGAALALMLLTDARRDARVGPDGRLRLLEDQDRSRWDRAAIAEGAALVRTALTTGPPGRYALQAAIAALHAEAAAWAETDWDQVEALYALLEQRWPTPVVALNRAVAHGFAAGPEAGLAALDRLAGDPTLASYPYLPSARADCLRRLGRTAEARTAYGEALLLTENVVEREFLSRRLAESTATA